MQACTHTRRGDCAQEETSQVSTPEHAPNAEFGATNCNSQHTYDLSVPEVNGRGHVRCTRIALGRRHSFALN